MLMLLQGPTQDFNNTHFAELRTEGQGTKRTCARISFMVSLASLSFFPRIIPDWNRLPQEHVAATALDLFKCGFISHLKKRTKITLCRLTLELGKEPHEVPIDSGIL